MKDNLYWVAGLILNVVVITVNLFALVIGVGTPFLQGVAIFFSTIGVVVAIHGILILMSDNDKENE
jgi:hypothetical protein